MARGWICLHREIQEHWIFEDAEKLRAWMIMLMTVNHKGKKTLIKGKLLECSRGQSLLSHSSWAEKFGKKWNRAKVIRFFKLLENDKIIEQVNEQVTTRLTICNYNKYQDELKKDEHQSEHVTVHQADTKRTGDSTQLNNDNNEKQIKDPVFNFKNSLVNIGVEKHLVSDWLKVRSKKRASNTETAFKALKTKFDNSGMSANDCVRIAVENSWSGFNADWLDEKPRVSSFSNCTDQELFNQCETLGLSSDGLDRYQLIAKLEAQNEHRH